MVEQEGIDQQSKSKMSEQSGADWNNENKNRKRCNIITMRRIGISGSAMSVG
jgi:hypothetical protein